MKAGRVQATPSTGVQSPPTGGIPPAGAAPSPAPAATSPYPTFSSSVINLAKIREDGRKALIELLDSVRGKKVLALDPKLSGPLGQIAEMSLLKEHGVEKIYYVAPGRFVTDSRTIVYIIRPRYHLENPSSLFSEDTVNDVDGHSRVELAKRIAENIENHKNEGLVKDYYVFFVPRRTMICVTLLEEHGVHNGEHQ